MYKVEKGIYIELISTSTSRDDFRPCLVNRIKEVSNQKEKQTWVGLKINYSF